jgi:hypothetical protein
VLSELPSGCDLAGPAWRRSVKRFLSIVSVLSVLALATSALALDFGWTLSGSDSDPMVNTGSPSAGVATVYLWYYCTNTAQGLASAEFDITGSSLPLAFTPNGANGFLNAGGATNLLLAVGGCPAGPLLAGSFLVTDAGSGFNLCISPAALNGNNVSVNCVALDVFDNDYIGYASDGTTPCQSFTTELCETPVSTTSWGNIKSLYR